TSRNDPDCRGKYEPRRARPPYGKARCSSAPGHARQHPCRHCQSVRPVAGGGRHDLEISDPTADDDHIRDRITRTIRATTWTPARLQVTVRDGIVDIYGVVRDTSRDRLQSWQQRAWSA